MRKEFMPTGKRYDIEYNGDTGKAHGVILNDYPAITGGSKQYDNYSVPGRIGELVSETRYTKNATIACTFSILSDRFLKQVQDIRSWLSGTGNLVLSDEPEVYYKVRKIDYGSISREIRKFGTFAVTFTCDPYAYGVDGQYEHDVKDVLWNPYDTAHPVYHITGDGECTLMVNDNIMTANVTKEIYIDTDLMIAYRNVMLLLATDDGNGVLADSDGALIRLSDVATTVDYLTSGNYENMYLVPGENHMSITEGFDLQVVPNWGYEI